MLAGRDCVGEVEAGCYSWNQCRGGGRYLCALLLRTLESVNIVCSWECVCRGRRSSQCFCFPVSEAAKVSRAVARWNSLSFVYPRPAYDAHDGYNVHTSIHADIHAGPLLLHPSRQPSPMRTEQHFLPERQLELGNWPASATCMTAGDRQTVCGREGRLGLISGEAV